MKLTGKASLIAGLLMAVTIAQATLTVVRDESALHVAQSVATKDSQFDQVVNQMKSVFYAYNGDVNRYVLASGQSNQSARANAAYRQAIREQNQFAADWAKARQLTVSPKASSLLTNVSQQIGTYNRNVTAIHHDIVNHQLSSADKKQAAGNSAPTNAIGSLLTKVVNVGRSNLLTNLHRVQNDQRAAVTWAWIETIVILAILGAMLFVIQRFAVKPILSLKGVAERLAQGSVNEQVPVRSNDELGELGDAFRDMMDYLREAGSVASAIGEGDLSVTPKIRSEADVLGEAFQNMMTYLTQAGSVASAIGRGDLSVTPHSRSPEDVLGEALVAMHARLRELIEALREAGQEVQESVDEVTSVVNRTNDSTRQISTAIKQTAQATSESSQGLQQITTAMQQLKTSVDQVTAGTERQADRARQGEVALNEMKTAQSSVQEGTERMEVLARQSRDTAEEGRQQVEETLEAMGRIAAVTQSTAEAIGLLGQHSEHIGTIVGTISEIAAQTNLLALNANIEAARAGEHGRGFAVVADEVRKLAEQSAQEATNVSELIRTIQETVQQSVAGMERGQQEVQSGQALGQKTRTALHHMDSAVSQVVEEIGGLAHTVHLLEEQSAGVDEGIREIARVAQDNAAAAGEMAQSSGSVADTVEGLAAISEETAASAEQVAGTSDHVTKATQLLTDKARVLSKVANRFNQLVEQYTL